MASLSASAPTEDLNKGLMGQISSSVGGSAVVRDWSSVFMYANFSSFPVKSRKLRELRQPTLGPVSRQKLEQIERLLQSNDSTALTRLFAASRGMLYLDHFGSPCS